MRGATLPIALHPHICLFQSTRPLRGATCLEGIINLLGRISIHAPLAGRDSPSIRMTSAPSYFNPRAPCGARHFDGDALHVWMCISIHAPLAGRDCGPTGPAKEEGNFNPRAPCGARQQKCTNCFAHFCDNRQVLSKFAQNAACQGILIPFPFGKSLQIWVRTARAISARLRFAL